MRSSIRLRFASTLCGKHVATAMTLRGWRLFGVAGTIFVYLAGILLLSFMSLNGPPQRHPQYRNGRYDVSEGCDLDANVLWATLGR